MHISRFWSSSQLLTVIMIRLERWSAFNKGQHDGGRNAGACQGVSCFRLHVWFSSGPLLCCYDHTAISQRHRPVQLTNGRHAFPFPCCAGMEYQLHAAIPWWNGFHSPYRIYDVDIPWAIGFALFSDHRWILNLLFLRSHKELKLTKLDRNWMCPRLNDFRTTLGIIQAAPHTLDTVERVRDLKQMRPQRIATFSAACQFHQELSIDF